MQQIIEMITNLLGGGTGNSTFIMIIIAVVFLLMNKKPTPAPTPTPKSSNDVLLSLISGVESGDRGALGDGPLIKWFLSLPAEHQMSFVKALLEFMGRK